MGEVRYGMVQQIYQEGSFGLGGDEKYLKYRRCVDSFLIGAVSDELLPSMLLVVYHEDFGAAG